MFPLHIVYIVDNEIIDTFSSSKWVFTQLIYKEGCIGYGDNNPFRVRALVVVGRVGTGAFDEQLACTF